MNQEESEVAECKSLALAFDAQHELSQALNSMAGNVIENVFDRYLGFGATHANETVDAYVLLRQTRRVKASKVLVRPAIESFIRMTAIHRNPTMLYRVVYGERKARNVWLKAWARRVNAPEDSHDEERDWEQFKQHCVSHIPDTDTKDAELSVESLASAAGLQDFYDHHYRVYSNFTHAALIAFMRSLDWLTDSEDNRVIATCAIGVIEVIAGRGAEAPHLSDLIQRLSLLKPPSLNPPWANTHLTRVRSEGVRGQSVNLGINFDCKINEA